MLDYQPLKLIYLYKSKFVKVKSVPTKRAGDSATPPEFMGGWRNTPSA
jgi:hypothetical protein